jgi:hypothetical protein
MNGTQLQFVWKLKHKSASRFRCVLQKQTPCNLLQALFNLPHWHSASSLARCGGGGRAGILIAATDSQFASSPAAGSILNILSIHNRASRYITCAQKSQFFTMNCFFYSFDFLNWHFFFFNNVALFLLRINGF